MTCVPRTDRDLTCVSRLVTNETIRNRLGSRMSMKTTQLSTRITDEDAAFLARLQIEGAQTPSDKIRALIGEARRRHESARDYRSALRRVAELLAPTQQELQATEHATGKHSELVRLMTDWVQE